MHFYCSILHFNLILESAGPAETVDRSLAAYLRKQITSVQIPDFLNCVDIISATFARDTEHALSHLLQQWSSPDVTHRISGFGEAVQNWNKLKIGSEIARSMSKEASILNASRMLGHWVWWRFLVQQIPTVVNAFLEHRASAHDMVHHPWMLKLIHHVHRLLTEVGPSFNQVIESSTIYPDAPSSFPACQAKLGVLNLLGPGEEHRALVDHVQSILAQWLNIQDQDDSCPRRWDIKGRLVDVTLELKHPGILLLEFMHNAFNISRHVSLDRKDAQQIKTLLRQVFVQNQDNAERISLLDNVLQDSLPAQSQISLQPLCFFVPQLLPNPASSLDVPSTLSLDTLTPEEVPQSLVDAGEVVLTILEDMSPLHSRHSNGNGRYTSPIPKEVWVS